MGNFFIDALSILPERVSALARDIFAANQFLIWESTLDYGVQKAIAVKFLLNGALVDAWKKLIGLSAS